MIEKYHNEIREETKMSKFSLKAHMWCKLVKIGMGNTKIKTKYIGEVESYLHVCIYKANINK